jgi:hypothetical protein
MSIDSVVWVEWVVVGAVMAAGALFCCFSFGVVVGYAWRDRISLMRRCRVDQELKFAELDRALAVALDEAVAANSNKSDRSFAKVIGLRDKSVTKGRNSIAANLPLASAGSRAKRNQLREGDVLHGPGHDRISTEQQR